MRRSAEALFVIATAGVVLVSAPALAQPEESGVAEARALFRSGLAAANEERWADALADFERSYALAPRASTLLNLAAAQAELGRLVEASQSYFRFLAEADAEQTRRYADDAERSLAEVTERIPRVRLSIPDLVPGDLLELDGVEVPSADLSVPIPMNPGAHVLTVTRDAQEIGRLELTLVESEERGVTLPLQVSAPSGALAGSPGTSESEDLLASPWLWVGIGGAVVLAVVIGVAIGVATAGGAFQGTLGPGMVSFE